MSQQSLQPPVRHTTYVYPDRKGLLAKVEQNPKSMPNAKIFKFLRKILVKVKYIYNKVAVRTCM